MILRNLVPAAALLGVINCDVLNHHVTGVRDYCDSKPCKNNGNCRITTGDETARGFICECTPDWAGTVCDVPRPILKCDKKKITISIDSRLVETNGLESSPQLISFSGLDDKECKAVRNDETKKYELTLNPPFNKQCSTKASRGDDGDYIFENEVVWKKVYEGQEGEAAIQRKLTLVNFKCDYEDEYLLHMIPIKPAESVIEQKTAKGKFQVDMKLYKTPSFEKDPSGAFNDNPIVRIKQQVCVKVDLKNKLGMEHLVMTVKDCWAASSEAPTDEEKHYIIQNKCQAEEEYTVDIIKNGIDNTAKFCFTMYKWREDMDKVFLQCKISVCDSSITFKGISQCRCAPSNFETNAWFYPNYYESNFEYYDYDYNGQNGMYSDSNNYGGSYFYYDYINPQEELESISSGRKRRALSEDAHKNKTKLAKKPVIDFSKLFKDENGKVILPKNIRADPPADLIALNYGPILIRPEIDPDAHNKASAMVNVNELSDEDKIPWFENPETADNIVLIAVGGSLIFAMIVLGVVIGVYVQFRNAASQKAQKHIEDQHKARELYHGVLKHGTSDSTEKIPAFIKNQE